MFRGYRASGRICTAITAAALAAIAPAGHAQETDAKETDAPAFGPPVADQAQAPLAQSSDSGPPPAPAPASAQASRPRSLARLFAPSGLLAEHNRNENFGALQARAASYRAHQALADIGGGSSGYRDRIASLVLPAKAIVTLSPDGDWYSKIGGVAIYSRGDDAQRTAADADSYIVQMEVLHLLSDRTMIGMGITGSQAGVDLLHNGGRIESAGQGVQLDLLHKVSDRFGISVKSLIEGLNVDTAIPRGPLPALRWRQDQLRYYVEASAIGTLDQGGIVPGGWLLRPVATMLYQRIEGDAARTTSGAIVPGVTENLAIAIAKARLEKREFRMWRLAPYAVLGAEFEIAGDISRVDDDPVNLYAKLGAGMSVGGKGRFDIYYARRESTRGTYRTDNVSVLLSMLF